MSLVSELAADSIRPLNIGGFVERVDEVGGMDEVDEVDGNSIHPAGRAQGFCAPGERRSPRNLLSF